MKKILFILIVFACLLTACQDEQISYLNTNNLKYVTSELKVVVGLTEDDTITMGMFGPQPSKYKIRIKNKSPWVGVAFLASTVEGARPLTVTLESVRTEGEGADAEIFKRELRVVGEGRVEIPYDTEIPMGMYTISWRIANIFGTSVVKDAYTVVVTDQK